MSLGCLLLPAVLVPTLWVWVSAVDDVTSAPGAPVTNSTGSNSTRAHGPTGLNVDSSMIQRALYVLIGITAIGILYFLIRAVRVKKPAHKKKYGLLSDYDDSVEMEAMESDEDDTLYEARSLHR